MQTDNRLYNIHDLTYREDYDEIAKTLESNSFSQLNKLTEWFVHFLFSNLTNNDEYFFSENLFTETEKEALKQGDIFYKSIFNNNNLIPEKFKDDEIDTPLTLVYSNSFNKLFSQKQSANNNLFIYSHFEKWLNEKLALQVTYDKRLNSFEKLIEVYNKTHSLYAYFLKDTDFYHNWITNVSLELIKHVIKKIKTLPINKKIYELAETRMIGRDKLQVEKHHLRLINENKNKTTFSFVYNTTKSSDLIHFTSEMSLANNLLLRLSSTWIEWLINIPYPILQDHAFFAINRIDTYRNLIDCILNSPEYTKNYTILIITLKNYVSLIYKITENLEYLQFEKQTNNTLSQNLSEDIDKKHSEWINKELKKEFSWLFEKLFPSGKDISAIAYFYDIFEWVASYTENSITGNRKQNKDLLKAFELFQKEFQTKLNKASNRTQLIENIPIEKLNWQYFEHFVELLDKTFEIELAEMIKQKYISLILSKQFKWDKKFEKYWINCAYKLAYVLSKLNTPLELWKEIYSYTEIHYEGWKVSETQKHQVLDKEIYVLLVGSCLSYIFFNDKQNRDATIIFDKILNITIQQCRIDNTKEIRYLLPLNFLALTASKYDRITTKSFIDTILHKSDDLEIILECANQIIIEDKSKLNDKAQTNQIIELIKANFDLLEYKYNDITQKTTLEYYIELKRLIIKEFA